MPDLLMIVDTALAEVPVNLLPLLDDTDFKTRETAVAYNAAGMDLVWNFITTGGAYTQTAVTPTTSGTYDWAHQGDGMYSIEIPASGGASINNDTEGFGWFTGLATGVLPWRGPIVQFSPANVVNSLVEGSDKLQVHADEITNGLITAAAIATGAIDADAIADNAIDAGALAADCITAAKIATGAIDADAIADNAIDAGALASGAITSAKFAAGAIDATAIADNAIDAGAIATGAITAAKFAAGAIDAAAIAADAITDAKVASDVTIASVTGSVGSVTGAVGSVTGAVGSVTGAVGSVTGNVGGNVVGSVGSVTTVSDKTGYRLSGTGVDDVWDEAMSGHTTAGTYGDKIRVHAAAVLKALVTTGSFAESVVLNATTGIEGGAPSGQDDFYAGRVIIFITGTLAGQATDITGYNGTTKTLLVTALTAGPSSGDTAVIV